jgi:precorrin-2 dehydrogenase/sirohydrochlorin ferrochelatase
VGKYFPINLDIKGKKCVVVGGGVVGKRKAEKLKAFGAKVILIKNNYKALDIKGAYLVFAATNNRKVNAAVARDAKKMGIPVNVADSAAESSFILPAVLVKKELTIAVSPSGKSPKRAVKVRDAIASYRFKS